MTIAALLLFGVVATSPLHFPDVAPDDRPAFSRAVADLAVQALPQAADDETRFRLELGAGRYADAVRFDPLPASPRLALFAKAKAIEAGEHVPYDRALARAFDETFSKLDDRAAFEAGWSLGARAAAFEPALARALERVRVQPAVSLDDALELVKTWTTMEALDSFAPTLAALIAADDAKRYLIDDVIITTREGAHLAATVVRKRSGPPRLTGILVFTIYTDPSFNLRFAKEAALRGYAGVLADARGKRTSPDAIVPWEVEAKDTYGVIDWIAKQPWSDGRVGMHGLSYSGFAQWAAAKKLHPALKTIVPAGASFPGYGLPMQNNVIQTANYAWPFYVTDSKLLDDATYHDDDRWSKLLRTWYRSGRPLREIDAIDGTPNPVFQKQMRHPSFDRYWQAMQPWDGDFARIKIPVLTLTGYFDPANSAAVNYLVEHVKHDPRANHYLVVGPYSHTGSVAARKDAVVNGYTIDPVADVDGVALVYQWFDHVFRGGPMPALIQDKINYEVMGANVWRHAPSIAAMASRPLTLYTSSERKDGRYRLTSARSFSAGAVDQTVDLADRSTENNLYPIAAYADRIDDPSYLTFVSDPFDEPVSIDGMIQGEITATIDKRDFDFTWALYEATPDGKFFNLSYYVGRASYTREMTKRRLLTPGQATALPFTRTPIVSRRLARGSRLVLLLTVNKNSFAQVNCGTGKDVSDESIADAKSPLHVTWHDGSWIKVPLRSGP
ncbi:MAG TPA: CocE/NonD family hydrolase [Candidatus Polarisedimenticolaceae bacterium]|nr:CocE/NonD family hydrolase [Candidatus Polarisedimenticolaceae bacterium]